MTFDQTHFTLTQNKFNLDIRKKIGKRTFIQDWIVGAGIKGDILSRRRIKQVLYIFANIKILKFALEKKAQLDTDTKKPPVGEGDYPIVFRTRDFEVMHFWAKIINFLGKEALFSQSKESNALSKPYHIDISQQYKPAADI